MVEFHDSSLDIDTCTDLHARGNYQKGKYHHSIDDACIQTSGSQNLSPTLSSIINPLSRSNHFSNHRIPYSWFLIATSCAKCRFASSAHRLSTQCRKCRPTSRVNAASAAPSTSRCSMLPRRVDAPRSLSTTGYQSVLLHLISPYCLITVIFDTAHVLDLCVSYLAKYFRYGTVGSLTLVPITRT